MYDLTPREWAAIVPLLALMVWMGTFTQTFLPSISAQNAQILQSTQTNQVRAEVIHAR
jgi:NADH-quinone oxidoreductase subunit M